MNGLANITESGLCRKLWRRFIRSLVYLLSEHDGWKSCGVEILRLLERSSPQLNAQLLGVDLVELNNSNNDTDKARFLLNLYNLMFIHANIMLTHKKDEDLKITSEELSQVR